MQGQIHVLNRMFDVAVSLRAAREHNRCLNRTQLQKFIYLLDVVGYLYEILPPREGHITYKHGPYDNMIQNAVDSLAFRGLVNIVNIKHFPEGNNYSEYILSSAGKTWCSNISKKEGFEHRWTSGLEVAEKVNSIGWERLVELVYAEPTFVSAQDKSFGQRIDVRNGLGNSAAFLIEMIRRGLTYGKGNKNPERSLMLELFFRYLDRYARKYGNNLEPQTSNIGI
jgi:hypothetical protein